MQPVKKAKKNDGAAAPKAAAKPEANVGAANGSRTIFCKNLPWSATDEDLAGFFADCGSVSECRIGKPSVAANAAASATCAMQALQEVAAECE